MAGLGRRHVCQLYQQPAHLQLKNLIISVFDEGLSGLQLNCRTVQSLE